MRTRLSRRGFFGVAGAAGLLVAAGCSQEEANGPPAAVTVTHKFGETTIPAPPQRVVSAGYTEQDDLLAVGVVPIAVTDWFGGEPFGVWPWAQPKLGAAQPVVLSIADGIQVGQIAALTPDLIVATNAGVDSDTYNQLSAIAPTIPQSGDEPFFEPWKTQATTIGQAVFQAEQMESLIAGVDEKFVTAGENNPQFSGKQALLLQGTFYQDTGAAGPATSGYVVATLPGWRTDFLTQMGLVIPDSIDAYARDHRAFIPRNEIAGVLDAADVLIWSTESDADQAGLLADPNVAQLAATRQRNNVFTGKNLAGAIAFASTLSYPVVADQLPPLVSAVL